MLESLDPGVLVFLALAGLAAGFVDAVVGGGGLIQLPALLLGFPGASPVQILATNKLASICGTTVSASTYARRIRPDPRTFGPLMVSAFLGEFQSRLVHQRGATHIDPPAMAMATVQSSASDQVQLKPSPLSQSRSTSPSGSLT